MGVSFISSDQACANAEAEIPDFDFAGVRASAFNTWDELLGRIQVDTHGVDKNTTELFYSSLYRTHISPADCELYLFSRALRRRLMGRRRYGREPEVELDGAVLRFVLLQRTLRKSSFLGPDSHLLAALVVGHLPHALLTYGPPRPRQLLQDRSRDA